MRLKATLVTALIVAASILITAPAEASTKSPSKACLAALTAAESITGDFQSLVTNEQAFFQAMGDSGKAHGSGTVADTVLFIQGITDAEQTLVDATNALTPHVQSHLTGYVAAATKCKAGH